MATSVPIAILRHDLPDGSSHVDLLVADPERPWEDEDRTVACWRCPARPDRIAASMDIERIEDHRGLYLRLEAPRDLSGDRGRVTPLRSGQAALEDAQPSGFTARVIWSDGRPGGWRFEPRTGPSWRLQPLEPEMSGRNPNLAP